MSAESITPDDRFATLVDEFVSNPDVTPPQPGRGFGSSGLKIRGKIFAMLVGDRLVVKLPKPRVDALVAAGQGERFDPRRDGRLMKEWLVVESASDEQWLSLASEALEFVGSQR